MAEYDLLYPPPHIPYEEHPESPSFWDELTGLEMFVNDVGYQNGLRKNANDWGSWEQRDTYKGSPRTWQVIPFKSGDDG